MEYEPRQSFLVFNQPVSEPIKVDDLHDPILLLEFLDPRVRLLLEFFDTAALLRSKYGDLVVSPHYVLRPEFDFPKVSELQDLVSQAAQ